MQHVEEVEVLDKLTSVYEMCVGKCKVAHPSILLL